MGAETWLDRYFEMPDADPYDMGADLPWSDPKRAIGQPAGGRRRGSKEPNGQRAHARSWLRCMGRGSFWTRPINLFSAPATSAAALAAQDDDLPVVLQLQLPRRP